MRQAKLATTCYEVRGAVSGHSPRKLRGTCTAACLMACHSRCLPPPPPLPWPSPSPTPPPSLLCPQAVCAEYDRMRAALRDPAARAPNSFTQPWLAFPPVKLE